ncbi:MAG: hypothetical protein LBN10_00885 [Propionibacteriaceae bacterium]|jgi:hypothetical protein|nr:hypothetical protein [Propionibacteriaceae bacterium]
MGWVVDQNTLGLRNAAVNRLEHVLDQTVYAQGRGKQVEGGTRSVMGTGHSDGDRVTQDVLQALACLERAQSAIHSAIAEVKQVNVMIWVPD